MDKMKRMMALLLALVMALGLAACGGGSNGGGNGGNGNGGKAEATPTPEYVYASEFTKLPGGESDRSLNVVLTTEKGFYGTRNEVVGQREPYPGETRMWDGQFNRYATKLYFMGFDGSMTELKNYEPAAVADVPENAETGTGIQGMALDSQGKLLVLENAYASWNEAPEGVNYGDDSWWDYYQNKNTNFISRLDTDGTVLSSVELDLEKLREENEWFSVYRMVLVDDGQILTSGDTGLYLFDVETGALTDQIQMEGDDWVGNIYRHQNGTIYAAMYGERSMELRPVDLKAHKLGEAIPVDGDLYNAVPGDDKYLLYFSDGNNFYGFDAEKNEKVKLFNWINVDILPDSLGNFTVLSDGSIVGLMTEWDNNYEKATNSLVTIKEVPSASLPEKTELTLACQYVEWQSRRQIVKFNRESKTVRVRIIDYSEYNDYEKDYDENGKGENGGLTKLRTEILAGNLPDILALDGMPTRQLAAKGLLLDLYPLLDADPELKREDFFPNVLKALEQDGKLIATASNFTIDTAVGASKVVGDTPGWTYEQLRQALAAMPEGCEVFGVGMTRDNVLSTCLALDMGRFVDWSTGKVSFDSQEFMDLLAYTKEFPASFDWQNFEWSEQEQDYQRIREGRQMLLSYGLGDFERITSYESIFGGPNSYTFIGYPTADGVGSLLRTSAGYAISRDCKNPEAAWEFLRVFLTEDYQSSGMGYGFPTNKKVYDQMKQKAMQPEYIKDEQGNFVVDPDTGERMMQTKGWSYDLDTMEESPIYFFEQEQLDRVEQVILNTERVADENKALYDIVLEQAQAYYAGQKSAEEVAKMIQSKANIYVNEQR